MRVLGIDPGSETLGWGVVEGEGLKYRLVDFGTVKSSPKENFSKRVLKIGNGVGEVIEKFQPDVISVEEAFFATNVKVALETRTGARRGALSRRKSRFGSCRIQPATHQTNRRRLRKRRKTSGPGNGQTASQIENRAAAARCGGRARHCDLSFSSRRCAE